jgi:HlyD family secretion protein
VYAHHNQAPPALTTQPATRGSVVRVVTSTGTLEAVTTVQVGAEVSGIVEKLDTDFNQIVKKGQIVAELEQSTFITAVDEAKAALANAQADAERLRVAAAQADSTLSRDRGLAVEQLIPAQDLETAVTASHTAAADVVAADAAVAQAKAAVESAEASLSKTVIKSPIDGVVVARSVDVGQTVNAGFSAPTLFVIAADLSQLQIEASIDESDMGAIAVAQPVEFHVDAFPEQTFHGTVQQIRLNPAVVQNVVTYSAMVSAPNPQLLLKPGMTATLNVEVARKDNVLRAPNAALRFRLDPAIAARLGAPAPPVAATGHPLPPTVWVSNGRSVSRVVVQTGLTDATQTEIIGAPFAEGSPLVTRATQ